MKFCYTIFLFIFFSFSLQSFAQKDPFNHPVCDTRVSDTGYYMKNAEAFLNKMRESNTEGTTTFSLPYVVRVFIRIVRDNDGSNPGCSVETAVQNFDEMNGQYNGHNICFQLMGVDFVNDTYLNNFNDGNLLRDVYPAYIRNNNLDVNGAITIFIHYNFLWNNGSSGNAYGIPNNFLSVARWAANSANVRSIFGHEMGHCLGLYHTFERIREDVWEQPTRSPANPCYNCPTDGDLCCDTPADFNNSQDYTNPATCIYSPYYVGGCDGLYYNPSTINIMSYQPWTCISTTSTALTPNQATRMHATINDPGAVIYSRVAEDNTVLGSTSNSGTRVVTYSAKNVLSTSAGSTISQAGNVKAFYSAGNRVVFSPGVIFSPGSSGMVDVKIAGCN